MRRRTVVALVAFQLMLGIEASGQKNIINTVAGSSGPTSGTAAAVGIEWTYGLAVDGNGNYYFSVPTLNRVYKVDPTGQLSVAAGNGIRGFGGDGGPAANAELGQTLGVAVDVFANLYLADSGNQRIRRVDAATGTIITIAGTVVTFLHFWHFSWRVEPGMRWRSVSGAPQNLHSVIMPKSLENSHPLIAGFHSERLKEKQLYTCPA